MCRSKGAISSGVQNDIAHLLCVLIFFTGWLHGHVCSRESPRAPSSQSPYPRLPIKGYSQNQIFT